MQLLGRGEGKLGNKIAQWRLRFLCSLLKWELEICNGDLEIHRFLHSPLKWELQIHRCNCIPLRREDNWQLVIGSCRAVMSRYSSLLRHRLPL